MKWTNKWFGFWSENPGFHNTPSVYNWIDETWWKDRPKSNVLEYLNHGIVISVTTSQCDRCLLCSCIIDRSYGYLTDGIWIWNNYLTHYIEHHNIVIPNDFYIHMRSSAFKVNIPHIEDEVSHIKGLDWSMFRERPKWLATWGNRRGNHG